MIDDMKEDKMFVAAHVGRPPHSRLLRPSTFDDTSTTNVAFHLRLQHPLVDKYHVHLSFIRAPALSSAEATICPSSSAISHTLRSAM
jgi:hypothetical protein